jgi:hypothetical protein
MPVGLSRISGKPHFCGLAITSRSRIPHAINEQHTNFFDSYVLLVQGRTIDAVLECMQHGQEFGEVGTPIW